MAKGKEKRKEERGRDCTWKAKYSIFAKSIFHESDVLDISGNGMRLRTKHPLKAGATLLVKLVPSPCKSNAKEGYRGVPNRTIGIGKVQWCERLRDTNADRYEVGLQFHTP